MRRSLVGLCSAMLLSAHPTRLDAQTRGTIVFHDVGIRAEPGAELLRNRTVVVTNGRVASIQPSAAASAAPRNARVVTGTGHYLAAAIAVAVPRSGSVLVYDGERPWHLAVVDSAIAPATRRSLILFATDPGSGAASGAPYVGVLLDGKWIDRAESERGAERAAKAAVRLYYTSLRRDNWSAACTGVTLYDCFAGDAECTGERSCGAKDVAPLRLALVARLEQAATVNPWSDWIAGQRVNFAVKQGTIEHAIALADSCRATLWWCQALRGYALHLAAWGGDAQMDSALAGAPAGTLAWAQERHARSGDRGLHCEWTDLFYLLNGRMRSDYDRVPCGANRDFEARYWFLADPMWSVPGNERRMEHISRNIAARLHDEILRLSGGVHPHTHHEQIMPGGVPNSWRPHPATSIAPQSGQALRRQYYVNGGYSFAPDADRFYTPEQTSADAWLVRWDRGDAERMIPRYTWHNLEHQTAALRRGAQLRVVAAARLGAGAWIAPTEAFIALGRVADHAIFLSLAQFDAARVMRAAISVDSAAWLVSVEMSGPGMRARARHGVALPRLDKGFGVSDLVLVREAFERDELTLHDAMLPTTALERGIVGVYFEVYGATEGEALQITLSTALAEPSLLQRLAGAIRLQGDPIRAAWLESAEPPVANVVRRFITIDTSALDNDRYRLVVQVTRGDGTTATGTRIFSVTR